MVRFGCRRIVLPRPFLLDCFLAHENEALNLDTDDRFCIYALWHGDFIAGRECLHMCACVCLHAERIPGVSTGAIGPNWCRFICILFIHNTYTDIYIIYNTYRLQSSRYKEVIMCKWAMATRARTPLAAIKFIAVIAFHYDAACAYWSYAENTFGSAETCFIGCWCGP